MMQQVWLNAVLALFLAASLSACNNRPSESSPVQTSTAITPIASESTLSDNQAIVESEQQTSINVPTNRPVLSKDACISLQEIAAMSFYIESKCAVNGRLSGRAAGALAKYSCDSMLSEEEQRAIIDKQYEKLYAQYGEQPSTAECGALESIYRGGEADSEKW